MTDYERILDLIDKKVAEAEAKATRSAEKNKYIMYGYWKAIAVHFRKIRREFIKGGKSI